MSEVIRPGTCCQLEIRERLHPKTPEVSGYGTGLITLLTMREKVFPVRKQDADLRVVVFEVIRKLRADEYPPAFRSLGL